MKERETEGDRTNGRGEKSGPFSASASRFAFMVQSSLTDSFSWVLRVAGGGGGGGTGGFFFPFSFVSEPGLLGFGGGGGGGGGRRQWVSFFPPYKCF